MEKNASMGTPLLMSTNLGSDPIQSLTALCCFLLEMIGGLLYSFSLWWQWRLKEEGGGCAQALLMFRLSEKAIPPPPGECFDTSSPKKAAKAPPFRFFLQELPLWTTSRRHCVMARFVYLTLRFYAGWNYRRYFPPWYVGRVIPSRVSCRMSPACRCHSWWHWAAHSPSYPWWFLDASARSARLLLFSYPKR